MKLFKETERLQNRKVYSLLLSMLFSRYFTSLKCIATEGYKGSYGEIKEYSWCDMHDINKVSYETKKVFLKSILYLLNTRSHIL